MEYIEVAIKIPADKQEWFDILSAQLSEYDFESFVQSEEALLAYVKQSKFNSENLDAVLSINSFQYQIKNIPQQNWNKVWEENFNPITVKDKVAIRAPFHASFDSYPYIITIEPKMSFGTGHHQTTQLMILQMLELDFNGKSVLDMGCGTGILAIFSSLLGADDILAVDIDEWAYENTLENIERNNIDNIGALCGDASVLCGKFDIIIANINRNILLQDLSVYKSVAKAGSVLLLSGFYMSDHSTICNAAEKEGFQFQKLMEDNNWVSALFILR